MNRRFDWYEVWADVSETASILLILRGPADQSCFEIYDPWKDAVLYTATSYEEAMHWLSEDEFVQVQGREDRLS